MLILEVIYCTAVDAGDRSASGNVANPIRPRFTANVNLTSSPLSSMVLYQSDTMRRGRDMSKSSLSSHYAVDTLANQLFQCYCSVWSTWTLNNSQGAYTSDPRSSPALSSLPSYVSLYIIWSPSLSIAYGSCKTAQCSTYILEDQPG